MLWTKPNCVTVASSLPIIKYCNTYNGILLTHCLSHKIARRHSGKQEYYYIYRRLYMAEKGKRPIKAAKRVVGTITKAITSPKFKEAVGLSGSVFKGGSMGQGTTVPHHYDIDLVLYSKQWRVKISETIEWQKREGRGRENGLKDALDELYRTTLTKIERYLCQKLRPHYKLDDIRGVALKFQYSIQEGENLSVDLLLSPHFKKKEQFFRFLQIIQPPFAIERLRFSVTASKWQTEYIKRQPMRVKELIRRAKHWRNRTWKHDDGKSGKPKSYLISLLVITAYDQVQQGEKTSFKVLAKQVGAKMAELVSELADEHISSLRVPIPDTERGLHDRYADMLPATPRIVDPVNPANNVYLSGVGPDPYEVGTNNDWGTFKRKAATIDLTIHPY